MIRYDYVFDAWVSGKNPDGQGMPTTNLTGDTEVCTCPECWNALGDTVGKNISDVLSIIAKNSV